MRHLSLISALPFLLVPLASGCSSDSDNDGTKTVQLEDNLEIFSWWTGGGEKQALQSLFDEYAKVAPDVDVTNAADADPEKARTLLAERMEKGEPPDSFQAISGVDLMGWVDDEKMNPISDLSTKNEWGDVFPSAVIDILSKDGDLFAVPANIERDNNLYYNMKVLADNDIKAPESLDEFYAACTKLKDANKIPLAVPAAGWVLALVAFETLLPGVNGGEYYNDFFAGKEDPEGDKAKAFFEELKKVLECSNVATAEGSWTVNADLVYGGDAAMYVMGDWAKGYYEGTEDNMGGTRDAWKPGEDFGVVTGLGSKGHFTFNSAVFGIPSGAQHPNAAKAFLETVASKDGQAAFNQLKGSVPARTDVDLGDFDDMVRGAAEDFKAAAAGKDKLLPGYASLTTFDFQKEINPSLLVFAVGGDRARQLEPDNVPADEAEVPALDVSYIINKVSANYSILTR